MKFDYKSPYGNVSPSDYNEITKALERLSHLYANYPLQINENDAGITFSLTDPNVWGFITSAGTATSGNTPYGWYEVFFDPIKCKWIQPSAFKLGTSLVNPAYEINNYSTPKGTIVALLPGGNSNYIFYCGLSTLGFQQTFCFNIVTSAWCTSAGMFVTQQSLNFNMPPGTSAWLADSLCGAGML